MLVGLKLISSLFGCTTKAVNHIAVDRDVTRSESKRSSVDEHIETNGGTSESLAIVQSSARCRWCCMPSSRPCQCYCSESCNRLRLLATGHILWTVFSQQTVSKACPTNNICRTKATSSFFGSLKDG